MDTLVPSPPTPTPRDGSQRVGDAERNAVCSQLSAHFAAGRLTADELDARLSAAVQAVTVLHLRRLLADLPPAPRAADVDPPPASRWGGLEVFALLVVLGALAVAAVAVVGLSFAGEPGVLVACFLGGSTAALGGAALTHLLHHHARSRRLPEQCGQRPRIA